MDRFSNYVRIENPLPDLLLEQLVVVYMFNPLVRNRHRYINSRIASFEKLLSAPLVLIAVATT